MTSPSRPYTERKAEVDSFVRAMATIWAEMPVDTRTPEPGDAVQVTDSKSRYRGCILTMIGLDKLGWYECQNGTSPMYQREFNGRFVGAVRVREVRLFRSQRAA
jgi:hypothetical protein